MLGTRLGFLMHLKKIFHNSEEGSIDPTLLRNRRGIGLRIKKKRKEGEKKGRRKEKGRDEGREERYSNNR